MELSLMSVLVEVTGAIAALILIVGLWQIVYGKGEAKEKSRLDQEP